MCSIMPCTSRSPSVLIAEPIETVGNAGLAVADGHLFDPVPDALGEQQGGFLIDFAEHHHKLLAAEPRRLVGGAD